MFTAAGLWVVLGYFGELGAILAVLGLAVALLVTYWAPSTMPRVGKWKLLPSLPIFWPLLAGGSYVFAWFLGGLIMYLLVQPLGGSLPSLIDVASLWALSGGASMVMVFVPAGLGIREITLSFLLRPYVGNALALVVALLMRVLFTLGDLIWGGLFWLLARCFGSRTT